MTAKIINLKQAKKQRQRREKDITAAANREKFGRKKSEKQRDRNAAENAITHLNNHKLDDDRKP